MISPHKNPDLQGVCGFEPVYEAKQETYKKSNIHLVFYYKKIEEKKPIVEVEKKDLVESVKENEV